MQKVLILMAISAHSANFTDTKFMHSDNKLYEMCGQMGHLIGPSGIRKAQLGHLVETFMRPFRQHGEIEFKKLHEKVLKSHVIALHRTLSHDRPHRM